MKEDDLRWEIIKYDYENVIRVRLLAGPYAATKEMPRRRIRDIQHPSAFLQKVQRDLLNEIGCVAQRECNRQAVALVARALEHLEAQGLIRDWLTHFTDEPIPAPQPAAGPDVLSPSDLGYPGAIPLPAPTWQPVPFLSDADWAAQNGKINDLLMRGKTE